jgi:nitroreductase/FMN reductase [NAD(P)H]
VSNNSSTNSVLGALKSRFAEDFSIDENLDGIDHLENLANRGAQRKYQDREVNPNLLRLLIACALSAPSKSDLQQADILIVKDTEKRRILSDLLPDQVWLSTAPVVLIFLANARRLVEIAKLRSKPFPNDHLDLFFNASVDTGIFLASFMRAADAVGLGTCPISVIRDHAQRVSELFELPDRVFPVAGMCVGWPEATGGVTPRLSLDTTVHIDSYDEGDLVENMKAFDERRELSHPLKPRDPERWGDTEDYGWSEDKARQFGVPQCADFGAFIRNKGFNLD